MPIRWRLTFWYTAVLLAVLVVLGSTVYLWLDYSMTAEIERNIDNKADEVLRSTRVVGALPFFLRQVVLPDVEVFAAPDIYLQVVTKNGEITVKSKNLGAYDLPVSQQALAEVLQGKSVFTTFSVENERLKMVVKPLLLEGDIIGFLQVARPLKPVILALTRLRTILILGGLGALIISVVLGWFLSGKTLKPIKEISREAKAIGEERDFRRRVNYEGPPDELGELAVTFNSMLGRLEGTYKQLADSLQIQQRFVADASHELRTPLTSIQGNVDFLLRMCKENKEQEVAQEVLSDISSETKRLARLVRDLLTLARVDAGLNLEMRRMELLPVLEETIRQARYLMRGQALETEVEEAWDAAIEANPDYFKQMLLIFFDNAFKFTPPGRKVSLLVRKSEEQVALVFRDEGPGIPQEELPHIFERFYRGQPSRTGEGAGLGLSIANWIAGEHHGYITVESKIDKGTVFTIYFPFLR